MASFHASSDHEIQNQLGVNGLLGTLEVDAGLKLQGREQLSPSTHLEWAIQQDAHFDGTPTLRDDEKDIGKGLEQLRHYALAITHESKGSKTRIEIGGTDYGMRRPSVLQDRYRDQHCMGLEV